MFTIGWIGEAAAASLTMDLAEPVSKLSIPRQKNLHTRHLVSGQRPAWPAGRDPYEQALRTWLLQREKTSGEK